MIPKLYLFYAVKGKQDFKIGDNIKDYMEDEHDFLQFKKPLDWGIDFDEEICGAFSIINMKKSRLTPLGVYVEGKKPEELINASFVITTVRGKICGIIPINHHNNIEEEQVDR